MELDKFIRMIPGREKKKLNVDLHELTFTYKEGHNTAGSLAESKTGMGAGDTMATTGPTTGTDNRKGGSAGGEGDSGSHGGGGGGV